MGSKETAGKEPVDGLVNRGNLYRLRQVMRRAAAGERVVLGFLGGSITQGSLAGDEEHTYVYRVAQWWQRHFPQASVDYVNGGIGGTDSYYGAARVREDILAHKPDVVFVDFSVNDETDTREKAEFFAETFEGVVGQILRDEREPAAVIINHVFYEDGHSAQEVHNRIGRHYELPCISMGKAIYERILAGEYQREEITPDGLHPGNFGHRLVAKAITDFLQQVKALEEWGEKPEEEEEPPGEKKEPMEEGRFLGEKRKNLEEKGGYPETGKGAETKSRDQVWWMPGPLTENLYRHCTLIRNDLDMVFRTEGFQVDFREKSGYLDLFSRGWTARRAGDRITFTIRCSGMGVQYRKVAGGPEQRAWAILDGNEEQKILLNGRFEETWGDCLYLQRILHHGEYGEHTLEITLIDSMEEGDKEFYLAGILIH